ncbi:hypothetical protein [Afifella marina]|uniref:Uncharacterized protein n=1 Tax=Afifella marina DSM 2698 TaxID=1120955 RepID=A0A1G5M8E6_AFIMA|nr:hypothetical protein [Afifella marina]MBK1622920.1 hypothetical protein [Afifella marina DSM 2698]MBK1625915.1 hypothetical protein [Afifella marina]MBK5917739.1 hypothetical protein [Afifella marina]RAI23653.1 hypothetical protein CH311_01920 [Afifella marina DSM 2698]SCZ20639.1 hypothetical protein SAMN03080610_00165 [Afifella marina DSM 2698]
MAQKKSTASYSTVKGRATVPAQSRADAIDTMADGIGGFSCAIRAIAYGWNYTSNMVAEPLTWAESSVSSSTAQTKRSKRRNPEPQINDDLRRTPGTEEAIGVLTDAIETAISAIQALTAGNRLSSDEVIKWALMADSKMTEFARLVPEEDFKAAIKRLWGRDAAPVRLR